MIDEVKEIMNNLEKEIDITNKNKNSTSNNKLIKATNDIYKDENVTDNINNNITINENNPLKLNIKSKNPLSLKKIDSNKNLSFELKQSHINNKINNSSKKIKMDNKEILNKKTKKKSNNNDLISKKSKLSKNSNKINKSIVSKLTGKSKNIIKKIPTLKSEINTENISNFFLKNTNNKLSELKIKIEKQNNKIKNLNKNNKELEIKIKEIKPKATEVTKIKLINENLEKENKLFLLSIEQTDNINNKQNNIINDLKYEIEKLLLEKEENEINNTNDESII